MFKIKVNGNVYEVIEEELTVKDRKLYNTKTKEYEGVEADIVEIQFERDGKPCGLRGTVGGYTCGSYVRIRPDYEYDNVKSKKIEHISPVVLVEGSTAEEEELALMTEG